MAYQPFAEALRAGLAGLDPEVVAAHVAEHGGEIRRLVPAIEADEPVRAEPALEQARLFDAVTDLLHRAAEDRPVVLVLDDLHWAAPSTIALLRHLLGADPERRLCVFGTYRDTEVDRSHALGGLLADIHRQGVERLALRGLDGQGVEDLVAAASGDELDDDRRALAAALAERTDGNPFFANQVLRTSPSAACWCRTADAGPSRVRSMTSTCPKACSTSWADACHACRRRPTRPWPSPRWAGSSSVCGCCARCPTPAPPTRSSTASTKPSAPACWSRPAPDASPSPTPSCATRSPASSPRQTGPAAPGPRRGDPRRLPRRARRPPRRAGPPLHRGRGARRHRRRGPMGDRRRHRRSRPGRSPRRHRGAGTGAGRHRDRRARRPSRPVRRRRRARRAPLRPGGSQRRLGRFGGRRRSAAAIRRTHAPHRHGPLRPGLRGDRSGGDRAVRGSAPAPRPRSSAAARPRHRVTRPASVAPGHPRVHRRRRDGERVASRHRVERAQGRRRHSALDRPPPWAFPALRTGSACATRPWPSLPRPRTRGGPSSPAGIRYSPAAALADGARPASRVRDQPRTGHGARRDHRQRRLRSTLGALCACSTGASRTCQRQSDAGSDTRRGKEPPQPVLRVVRGPCHRGGPRR